MFPLLETLVAVYEVGQFTLAADELKVSQSTVSSRIAQLEQMVGAPLFVRNAKSDVTPTQAGRMLYQTAGGSRAIGGLVLAYDRRNIASQGIAGHGPEHGWVRFCRAGDELGRHSWPSKHESRAFGRGGKADRQ